MADAAELADRLERRDRERDDRRVCLECSHLSGVTGWRRCGQWQRSRTTYAAGVLEEMIMVLHRCAGFEDGLEPAQ